MKLVSFQHQGRAGWGVVEGERVHDLTQAFPDATTLKAAIAAGRLTEIPAARSRAATYPLREIRFLPVIPDPGKIICVGVNYGAHLAETGRAKSPHPMIFLRPANGQVGHGEDLWRPRVSSHFDFEGELAVVIGRRGRHIAKADALSYVAGWSCYFDGSVRDYQKHTAQVTPGKMFYRTGGFGPWLVTLDEAPDPGAFELRTLVNGEEVQRGACSDLIFDVGDLIAYASAITELEPGDVISTGTPEGVGQFRTPPLWLKAGDRVEVRISGVGVLAHEVADEPSA